MIVRYLPRLALVVSWDGRTLTHHSGDAQLLALQRYLPAGDHALATNAPAAFDDEGALVFVDGERLLRLPLGGAHAELVTDGVPEARGLHVANGGELVALRRGYGAFDGEVVVRSLPSGALLWQSAEPWWVDSVSFSASGELLLWEWDRPVQSGSDVIEFGVCRAATGEGLFSDGHTTWDESYYWGADDRRLLYGRWGQTPRRARDVLRGGANLPLDRGELIGVQPLAASPPAMPSFEALRRQLRWTP